ncbi:MAG: hypothetical protein ABSA02_15185 [Trebonia sp.]
MIIVGLDSSSRNTLPGKDEPGAPRTGRHARPVSPPAAALSDVLRDRSLERIKAADRAITDAQARLRSTGADSDAVNGAFAVVRDSLSEARETVREARRELALVLNEWEQLHRRLQGAGRYPQAATPVVPDPPGLNLCPDAGTARTPAQFMDTLRKYRKWAGEPSFRVMEHVIRQQRGQHFAASTIHAALKSDDLPSLQKVQAIITACGGSDAHQQMFTTAWRQLTMPRRDEARQPRARTLCAASETA